MIKRTAAALAFLMTLVLATGCNTSKKAEEQTTGSKAETENITIDFSRGLNKDGTLANVNPEDYVTLYDYKKMKLSKEKVTATDEEVQQEIDAILQQYPDVKKITDASRKVKDGDTVNIDYSGKVDGKQFDGGTAQGYDLVIGSGSFIDGFESQLVGHSPGETFDIKVTFPKNYQAKDLAGKEAVFTITINYIKEQKDAELTDDFVKKNLSQTQGYTSVKDMKQKIRDRIEENKKKGEVWNQLMENSTFKDIPKELVNPWVDTDIEQAKSIASSNGISFEDYLKNMGQKNEEAYRESRYEELKETVKSFLVIDAIAKAEKLKVAEEDLKKSFAGQDYSSYINYYSENYINRIALNDKVISHVADMVQTDK